jgi:hypothetical protein
VLSASPAFTQAPSTEATSEAKAAAPVAFVYVGTTAKGVYLFETAADGKLTLVSGSPFKTSGLAIGSNGTHFITLGKDWIHSYPVESDGAIGKQVSTINTQLYNGAICGATNGAVLDHTGQNLYVLLDGALSYGSTVCDDYQAFDIGKSSGDFTFNSDVISRDNRFSKESLPTLTGDDKFGYSINWFNELTPAFSGISRASNGALDGLTFQETDPTPQSGWYYYPFGVVADPTNHLAVYTSEMDGPPFGSWSPGQLASYSVDDEGNILSTNTWEDMPTPDVYPTSMNISPSGKLLAVAGNLSDPAAMSGTPGLQIFHFNGSSPITPYSATLTTTPINQIHWDNNNHLYALSDSTSQLFVYTITPTSIDEAPGSPYKITSPNALVVVPKR